jgi:hypothetical protein
MNDYVIGAGAVLTAGPTATIAGATLHMQVDPLLAPSVGAALVDFESSGKGELTKVVIVATGWNPRRVQHELVAPLLARRECTLSDLLVALGQASGTNEVHVFAQWLVDDLMCSAASRAGVTLVSHSLDTIRQAALISGQTFSRWPSPLRAA